MLVGYARTSSLGQVAGLEAQERDLRVVGCDRIFSEQVSSVAQREQLEAALDYVREGDTFTVTKLGRLARSVGDLLEIVARLEAKKVSLRVLAMSGAEPLDTGTATGRLMLAVIGAVGQAERKAMLERQREGIAKAKREGRYKGRVPTARRKADEIDGRRSNLPRRTARLADTKTGASLRPLSELACMVIRAQPRIGDVVFASRSGAHLPADITPHVLHHSVASLAADLGYNEPTIASLLGHKTHSITSRYLHSADAVLVAAADAVASTTMKLMTSDQAQPQLRDQRRDAAVVRDGITSYRCFRDTWIWQVSDIGDRICHQPGGTKLPLYRCFRPTRSEMAHFCLLASSNLGRDQTTLPT